MQKFIKPGDTMTFTAPGGGVTGGTPLLIGGMVVVPITTVAATLPFEGMTRGVFTAPKTAGVAWTEGQVLYWDSAAGSFATAQSATARRAGIAAAAALLADTTGQVYLVNVGAPVAVV